VGDLIRLTPDEWRINGTAPADDWRFASKLLCRLEPDSERAH
jgi:hypothetical protein